MWSLSDKKEWHWFVMRDLKRPNAKLPAYRQLRDEHFEVFVPMKWHLATKDGKRTREERPIIQDLLFVHSTMEAMDVVVDRTPTLQYRYKKGGVYREPMTVPDADMERFICAVGASENPRYYMPGEVTPDMCGSTVRIVGGSFDGYEGRIMKVRGTRKRWLLIELPEFFSVGVEIKNLEYVQLLETAR